MKSNGVQNSTKNHQDAFALVIALTLMAFVLLLMLSMVSLVQIERRAASNGLQVLLARENARLALMLAIGELQKHAGPDQRVIARADILGDDRCHPSARFWTGVWDTTRPTAAPTWLVSGENADPGNLPRDLMQVVGPGSTGSDSSQYVYAPTLELSDLSGQVSHKIAWWISDEGGKASVGTLPLKLREVPNFLASESIKSIQLQIASTHGLEAIFEPYDRFTSTDARMLDRISSIKQLVAHSDFLESNANFSGEAPFHALTTNSCGVLANTLASPDGGLMQDLSLFPALLGPGLKHYLQLGEQHANALALKDGGIAGKRLFTGIQGLDAIGPLQDGEIATPIVPILSNFMMAFTIRSKKPVSNHPDFYLRARFFCEFWNPFTHSLSMLDSIDQPIDLELEITGLPEITVTRADTHKSSPTISSPISLQNLMGDPSKLDRALTVRLVNDINEVWLPGRSKNWIGIETTTDPVHSPYQSVVTNNKRWDENKNTLGKADAANNAAGINTSEPRFPGQLQHQSNGLHTLRIKVYMVTDFSRKLISDLNGFLYEPVSTRSGGYSNIHANMTFGYHIMLRGPHLSNDDMDFYRGRWLNDHDPRNPIPLFRDNWHLSNDINEYTGSAYVAVIDGLSPIHVPEPQRIHQKFGTSSTINSDCFQRLLDRSSGSDNLYNKLWQDAPLFELPRERVLSLASLQHVYMHNERPFQVGNSWGSEGKINASAWFDRYYFSGLSRNDEIADFRAQAGPSNPILRFLDADRFRRQLSGWKSKLGNDSVAAREPAETLLVVNRFNINSTSVVAWKAVLASLRLHDFGYIDYPENDTSDLRTLSISNTSRPGSFARFSHSLEETYEAPPTPAFAFNQPDPPEPVAPSAFYRHGARRFDHHEFEALAREIVRRIKIKGTTFRSMQEFLSEQSPGRGSLMEQAIATVFSSGGKQQWDHTWETAGVRGSASSLIDIDHFSPGFLTQADVMTAIGSMLAVRSDTFKIRARGQSVSALGTLVGSATIEAILQRIPQAIDSTAVINQPTRRKLKLLSIRWLTDDER